MAAQELKVAGPARLVSEDGQMDMTYQAAANGVVNAVTLKLTPPSE